MKLVLGSRRFNSVAAYAVQDEESTRYEFDSQRPQCIKPRPLVGLSLISFR